MMKKPYRVFILLLLLLVAENSLAQIINTESAKMQTDTLGWMGNAHANFGLTKSVDKIINTDIGIHMQYKIKKHLWILMANYNFLKGANQKYVDNRFVHFRYAFKVIRRLNLESYIQAESNLITQLESRYILGAGPRVKVFSNKLIHLHVASHLNFERKIERTTPDVAHHDLRSSSYFSFVMTPNERLEFSSTFFYQPVLKNFNDFRILNYATLKVKAAKHLALSVRWYLLHDHLPIGTAPESLYTFGTGVDYDF